MIIYTKISETLDKVPHVHKDHWLSKQEILPEDLC
jgi:hypothetical protein